MFGFLVGGITRGKVESVQSRKLWGVVERNEGIEIEDAVLEGAKTQPPRKNLKNPQKKKF